MEFASQEAQRLHHEYIGTEHVLLGIILDGECVAAQILLNMGVKLVGLRQGVEKLAKPGPNPVTMGKLPQTPRTKKTIEHAVEVKNNLSHQTVGTGHLLLGILRQADGAGATVLRENGVELEEARKELLNIYTSFDPETEEDRTQ